MPSTANWGGAFFRSERLARGRRVGEQDDSSAEYSPLTADNDHGLVLLLLDNWIDNALLDRNGGIPRDEVGVLPINQGDFATLNLRDLIGDFEIYLRTDLGSVLTDLSNAAFDLSTVAADRFDQIFVQDSRDLASGFDLSALAARIDLGIINSLAAQSLGDFG